MGRLVGVDGQGVGQPQVARASLTGWFLVGNEAMSALYNLLEDIDRWMFCCASVLIAFWSRGSLCLSHLDR